MVTPTPIDRRGNRGLLGLVKLWPPAWALLGGGGGGDRHHPESCHELAPFHWTDTSNSLPRRRRRRRPGRSAAVAHSLGNRFGMGMDWNDHVKWGRNED
jgi:hypothetical protein